MPQHKIVSQSEWTAQRKAFLAREKEFTRARDRLSAERRALPWVKVEKPYVFETPAGKKTLAELFDGKSQLIVYHFMLGPGWVEGCPSCSYLADHFDGAIIHLSQRDAAFVVVSRAPLAEIEAYKKRMGWQFRWVSSFGSDFNFDYQVAFRDDEIGAEATYNYERQEIDSDEMPGASVFYKDESGRVFHTYSSYARGNEEVVGAFIYLDMTPKGRNEKEIMDWVKRNDEYDISPQPCCQSTRVASNSA